MDRRIFIIYIFLYLLANFISESYGSNTYVSNWQDFKMELIGDTNNNQFHIIVSNFSSDRNYIFYNVEFELQSSALGIEGHNQTNWPVGGGWYRYRVWPLDDYRVIYPERAASGFAYGDLKMSDTWYSGPWELRNVKFTIYKGGERMPMLSEPNYPEAVQLPETWRYGDLIQNKPDNNYETYTNTSWSNRILSFRVRRYHPTQLWLVECSNFKDRNYGQETEYKMIRYVKKWAMVAGWMEEIFCIDMNYIFSICGKETGLSYLVDTSGAHDGSGPYVPLGWTWTNALQGDGPWQQVQGSVGNSILRYPDFYDPTESQQGGEGTAISSSYISWVRTNVFRAMLNYVSDSLWRYEFVNAFPQYLFADFEANAADKRSDLKHVCDSFNAGEFGVKTKMENNCRPENYRYEAMQEPDLCSPINPNVTAIGGIDPPNYAGIVEESLVIRGSNRVGNRLFNSNISWEDVTNFFYDMKSQFEHSQDISDDTWNLMLSDLEMAFNVLKNKPHNDGTHIQFRYDWATMCRVMKWYLPKWVVAHPFPQGTTFLAQVIGSYAEPPPPPPSLTVLQPSAGIVSNTIAVSTVVSGPDTEHTRWCRYKIIYPCGETIWSNLSSSNGTNWNGVFDTTSIPDGNVTFEVRCEASTGLQMTQYVALTINNGWDTSPCITINTPENNSILFGTNNPIITEVNDNFSVSNVWYRIGSGSYISLSNTSSSIWSNNIDVSSFTDGSYYIVIRALDNTGNYAFESNIIIVQNDHPPIINISTPQHDEFIQGTYEVKAEVTDAEGSVSEVYIKYSVYSDGLNAGWSNMPHLTGDFYHFFINTTNLEDRPLYIWIKAKDNRNSFSSNSTRCYIANDTYPTITWLNCTEGQDVFGLMTFNLTITDKNYTLTEEVYSINSNAWQPLSGTVPNFNFTVNFSTNYTNGQHIQLRVKAVNDFPRYIISTRNVVVNTNPAPVITILKPANYQVLSNNGTYIKAEIIDNGTISLAQYRYSGGSWSNLSYSGSNNIYTEWWNYSVLPNNDYTLYVRAEDNSGKSSTNSMTVIVNKTSGNSTPIISGITSFQTNDGSGKVIIRYTGVDTDNDNCTYVLQQYSQDSNTWTTMTKASNDSRHSSEPLGFTSSGADLTYVWDSQKDISGVYDNTMWIRLQVNDGASNSSIVASSSFMVDNVAPDVVTLVSPASNTTVNTQKPTFIWDKGTDTGTGISSYEISINGDIYTSGTTNYTPVSDLTNGTYNWRVRGIDGKGNRGNWSSEWVVVVDVDTTPPSEVTLIEPVSNSITTNREPQFKWTQATDNKGVSGYEIVIGGHTNSVSGATTTNYTPGSGLSEGWHNWEVRAIDTSGNRGGWSSEWVVGIDINPPDVVSLQSPGSNSILNNVNYTFQWYATADAVSGVSNYIIQISTNKNFTNYFVNIETDNLNCYIENLKEDLTNWWRVKAYDRMGHTNNWSSIWSIFILKRDIKVLEVKASDGIHLVNIANTDLNKTLAYNAQDITFMVKINGDTNEYNNVKLKYKINFEPTINDTDIILKWDGSYWSGNLSEAKLKRYNNGDKLYFKFLVDNTLVENNYNEHNSWVLILRKIEEQENNITILNNVIQNNADERVTLMYNVESNTPVHISIYNIYGGLVKTLIDEEQSKGTYIIKWNGKDMNGNKVAPGIYFAIVKYADKEEIKKIMIK